MRRGMTAVRSAPSTTRERRSCRTPGQGRPPGSDRRPSRSRGGRPERRGTSRRSSGKTETRRQAGRRLARSRGRRSRWRGACRAPLGLHNLGSSCVEGLTVVQSVGKVDGDIDEILRDERSDLTIEGDRQGTLGIPETEGAEEPGLGPTSSPRLKRWYKLTLP